MPHPSLLSRLRSTNGFSLVELVVSMLLLGILVGSIGITLNHQRRDVRNTQSKALAQVLIKNTVERLRSAGPVNYQSRVGEYTVNEAGERDPEGDYLVQVSATVLCSGGEKQSDGKSSEVSSTCTERDPIVSYHVRVGYPQGGDQPIGSLEYEFKVGEDDRFNATAGT